MDKEEKNESTPILPESSQNPLGESDQDPQASIKEKIEQSKSDGWNKDTGSFLEKNRGALFPFIVFILIIVIGISLIRILDNGEDEVATPGEEGQSEETQEPSDEDETSNGEEPEETVTTTPTTTQEETKTATPQVQYATPEVVGNDIMVSAQIGDGITHLARKSVSYWLDNNNDSLTAEQLIYAEDYLQNMVGTHYLEIGETLPFSTTSIETAVSLAKDLQPWQIQNLSQYVIS